jgi:ATP-dependent Clp protease ATP-binding subunit ClpA
VSLQNQVIWSLDVSSLVAGTKYRGDFEERMKHLLTALKSLPQVILFIDEIHMIMGAGGNGQSSMDAANILKPALGQGEIRVIGSTTYDEFRKHFEKDRALLRRFQKQDVHEPSVEHSLLIVQGLVSGFETFHGVTYDPQCVNSAVDLSVKYIMNRHLPDKAIDLIDAAGAWVKVNGRGQDLTVTPRDIELQISRTAGVSVQTVSLDTNSKLRDLETHIRARLFGQDSAVTQICEAVWMSYSGLREGNKTMGSFLLTGPSGVGKTAVAQLLASELDYSFVRFDMSEFQERHSVSRFIGSPPGYVGYGDGAAGSGALINALETTPSCVLLIDEVEKAHPDVLNIFLQAMDRGEITSQNQKTVSMRNAVLIFTSNLGASEMEKHHMGFGARSGPTQDSDAVQRFFAPEFRNRLDSVIQFDPLSPDVMLSIVDKFLTELNLLSKEKNVHVVLHPDARTWLAQQGYSSNLGARPLSRVIDAHIKKPMSREILFGKLQTGGRVMVSVNSQHQLSLEFLSNCDLGGQSPEVLIKKRIRVSKETT